MAAGGADAADPAGRCPPRDRLRVHTEQGSHLTRCEETIPSVHSPLLASRRSTARRRAFPSAVPSVGRTPITASPGRHVRQTTIQVVMGWLWRENDGAAWAG